MKELYKNGREMKDNLIENWEKIYSLYEVLAGR